MGYITGNSLTSVSGVVVFFLLGFISIVLKIITGKESNERISKNLDILTHIFYWFLSGMVFGVVLGSSFKGLYFKVLQSETPNKFLQFIRDHFPPISHEVTNIKP